MININRWFKLSIVFLFFTSYLFLILLLTYPTATNKDGEIPEQVDLDMIHDRPAIIDQSVVDQSNDKPIEQPKPAPIKPEPQKQEQPKQQTTKSGLTKQSGVCYYNGMKETYYSSKVLRHKDTNKWVVDAEGFYKDCNGYYVVSSNPADHNVGEVFNTSKGLAKRYDTGCPKGVIDFYVNF